jgi:hypothetical protein
MNEFFNVDPSGWEDKRDEAKKKFEEIKEKANEQEEKIGKKFDEAKEKAKEKKDEIEKEIG